jgi:hypothetical protein
MAAAMKERLGWIICESLTVEENSGAGRSDGHSLNRRRLATDSCRATVGAIFLLVNGLMQAVADGPARVRL